MRASTVSTDPRKAVAGGQGSDKGADDSQRRPVLDINRVENPVDPNPGLQIYTMSPAMPQTQLEFWPLFREVWLTDAATTSMKAKGTLQNEGTDAVTHQAAWVFTHTT